MMIELQQKAMLDTDSIPHHMLKKTMSNAERFKMEMELLDAMRLASQWNSLTERERRKQLEGQSRKQLEGQSRRQYKSSHRASRKKKTSKQAKTRERDRERDEKPAVVDDSLKV